MGKRDERDGFNLTGNTSPEDTVWSSLWSSADRVQWARRDSCQGVLCSASYVPDFAHSGNLFHSIHRFSHPSLGYRRKRLLSWYRLSLDLWKFSCHSSGNTTWIVKLCQKRVVRSGPKSFFCFFVLVSQAQTFTSAMATIHDRFCNSLFSLVTLQRKHSVFQMYALQRAFFEQYRSRWWKTKNLFSVDVG